MKFTSCFFLILLSLTILSCQPKKIVDTQEFNKYVILCKKDYIPKKEDFSPSYSLADAKRVNKTKNEWLITLMAGEQSLADAEVYLENVSFIVSVISSEKATTKTVNSKKSKTGILKN